MLDHTCREILITHANLVDPQIARLHAVAELAAFVDNSDAAPEQKTRLFLQLIEWTGDAAAELQAASDGLSQWTREE